MNSLNNHSTLNPSKYLNQSNFFTRSVLKIKKEIHKDLIYLIQNNIDFFGTPRTSVKISLQDYLNAKNVIRNNSYSFWELFNLAKELTGISGAFHNRINNHYISFNLIDNVQIDSETPETFIIELGTFGKIFFFKKALEVYIKGLSSDQRKIKYPGHTQIERNIFNLNGKKRKKFFELISQFKNTGYCKISLLELKMILGYITIIDKTTKTDCSLNEQLRLLFLPEDQHEIIDSAPRYSEIERSVIIPAINSINEIYSKEISNLKLTRKIRSGRKITHLEFTFSSHGSKLNNEEQNCLKTFLELGLEKSQILYLISRIGHQEMITRYIHMIDRRVDTYTKTFNYFEKKTHNSIINISGYLYSVVFPELKK